MTIKQICESIVTYDSDNLSTTLEASIIDSGIILRGLIGNTEYILYKNYASSITIESITLDPDSDDSDLLELAISNDDLNGLIEMSSFEGEYTFLNDKIELLTSGTDDDGDAYRYIRIATASGFDTEYDADVHGGAVSSLWYEDMQRAQAYAAISIFVPMARRISDNVSIYINEGYGDSNMAPSSVEDLNIFSTIYMNKARTIIKDYYINKYNNDNSVSSLISSDLSDAKTNFGYKTFGG